MHLFTIDDSEIVNYFTNLQKSFSNPQGQFQSNLAQSFIKGREFKFVQVKNPNLFQGKIIVTVRMHWQLMKITPYPFSKGEIIETYMYNQCANAYLSLLWNDSRLAMYVAHESLVYLFFLDIKIFKGFFFHTDYRKCWSMSLVNGYQPRCHSLIHTSLESANKGPHRSSSERRFLSSPLFL